MPSARSCAPSGSDISLEALEDRRLLAAAQINFVLNDPDELFAAHPLFAANLQVVSQILSQHLEGKGSIEVEVNPNSAYSGGPAMAPSGVQFVSSDGYFTTVEYNTEYEARTGIDPNGAEPDIRMYLDPGSYLDNVAFLDPSGAARTAPIPADRQDFISAMLRGMVRELGMYGYQFTSSGAYGFGWGYYIYQWSDGSHLRSTYDKLRGSLSTFDGANATAINGGPVQTTLFGPGGSTGGLSDFYFLGMPDTPLENDLMNGMGLKPGVRYDLSPVDVAILTDVGWMQRTFPKLPGDLNDDGVVSIADFITLASNFGKSNMSYADGDVNDDGAVSISDLLDLSANFNQSYDVSAAQPLAAASLEITAPITRARKSPQARHHHRNRQHQVSNPNRLQFPMTALVKMAR